MIQYGTPSISHKPQLDGRKNESAVGTRLVIPVYKITLIGDGAVGKTSLRDNFMAKPFKDDYLETNGADFATKKVEVHKRRMRFQIWDIAGQPHFAAVREIHREVLGALLIFDISRHSTLENAPNWVVELWKNNERGKVPVVALGNKIDLRDSCSKAVSADQGQTLPNELSEAAPEAGFEIRYFKTSAKTGENVDRALSFLGESIIDYIEERLGG